MFTLAFFFFLCETDPVKASPSPVPSDTIEHCGTTTEHDLQYKSNTVVYADCNASNRGLFAGNLIIIHLGTTN